MHGASFTCNWELDDGTPCVRRRANRSEFTLSGHTTFASSASCWLLARSARLRGRKCFWRKCFLHTVISLHEPGSAAGQPWVPGPGRGWDPRTGHRHRAGRNEIERLGVPVESSYISAACVRASALPYGSRPSGAAINRDWRRAPCLRAGLCCGVEHPPCARARVGAPPPPACR